MIFFFHFGPWIRGFIMHHIPSGLVLEVPLQLHTQCKILQYAEITLRRATCRALATCLLKTCSSARKKMICQRMPGFSRAVFPKMDIFQQYTCLLLRAWRWGLRHRITWRILWFSTTKHCDVFLSETFRFPSHSLERDAVLHRNKSLSGLETRTGQSYCLSRLLHGHIASNMMWGGPLFLSLAD